MTISDLIIDVRRLAQEPDADPNGFFSDSSIKRYIKRAERKIARYVQTAFETTRTFSTSGSAQEYSVPGVVGPDTFGVFGILYSGTAIDNVDEKLNIDHGTVSTGTQPSVWYMRGTTLGFNSIPPSGVTISVYTHRQPPFYALSVYHDGSASETAVTLQKSGNYVSISRTIAAVTTTTDVDLLVTGANMSGLVSGLNSISGVKAVRSNEILGTESGNKLADFSSTSILLVSNREYLVEETEVPQEYSEYLSYGTLELMYEEDGQPDKAQYFGAKFAAGMQEMRREFARQKRSYGFRGMVENGGSYPGNYRRLGDGGYVNGPFG